MAGGHLGGGMRAVKQAAFLSAVLLCAGCFGEQPSAEIHATVDQKARVVAQQEVAPMDATDSADSNGRRFRLVRNGSEYTAKYYQGERDSVTFIVEPNGNTVFKSGKAEMFPEVVHAVSMIKKDQADGRAVHEFFWGR